MTTPAAIPTKWPSSAASPPVVAHHFDDWEQQYESCILGMWAFLVSEVMFFGGVFATYMVYRIQYPDAFAHASHHLNVYWGTFNTFVLLTSSLTMALAVRAAHLGRSRQVGLLIALTIALGTIFLGIKFYEYYHKYEEGLMPVLGLPFNYVGPAEESGPARLFYGLYFAMTGVHALHMIIGIAIMTLFIPGALRGKYAGGNSLSVEVMGLYWHFVDLVWIFLFPLLYLVDRSFMSTTAQPSLRIYLKVYLLLMLGLAATVGVAYVPLGSLNLAAALAIAFAKATLVVLFFMHVLYSPRLTWIAVFSGLVWLGILLALVGADYVSRDWIPVEPVPTGLADPLEADSFELPRSASSTGSKVVSHAED